MKQIRVPDPEQEFDHLGKPVNGPARFVTRTLYTTAEMEEREQRKRQIESAKKPRRKVRRLPAPKAKRRAGPSHCWWCTKPFTPHPSTPAQKYCNAECRQAAYGKAIPA